MHLPRSKHVYAILFLSIGFIGFADSSFLALKHYLRLPVPCAIVRGCDIVTTSPYSMVGPIPLAVLGMVYYLSIIILAVLYIDSKRALFLSFLARFTAVGFVASLYLIFLQAVVLKAFCLYCLISATTSTLLFLIGVYMVFLEKKHTML